MGQSAACATRSAAEQIATARSKDVSATVAYGRGNGRCMIFFGEIEKE
jgi:hypothetical protein